MQTNQGLNIGDYVYLTKTADEITYRPGHFKTDGISVPIMRKIIAVVVTSNGVQYQLSGCGVHVPESAIGEYVFKTYEEADDKLRYRRN